MNLTQHFLTKNNCYKVGEKLNAKGLMLHSTGANNPNLSRYVDDPTLGKASASHWNQPEPGGRKVCVHGFIGKDKDGKIRSIQTLPFNMRGWHAGGSANDAYIGWEICEDDLKDPVYFSAVYKEAVELFAHICKLEGLTEKNIITHCEGYKLGIASNHGDVMHWFPKHGKSMDTFRADVKVALKKKSDGWQKVDGKWYYYKAGAKQTGWVLVKEKWYLLGTDGAMLTGWQKVDGKWYYLNEQGDMAIGWKLVKEKWYYLNEKGVMLTGLVTVKGRQYYLEDDGALRVNSTVKIDKDGHLLF